MKKIFLTLAIIFSVLMCNGQEFTKFNICPTYGPLSKLAFDTITLHKPSDLTRSYTESILKFRTIKQGFYGEVISVPVSATLRYEEINDQEVLYDLNYGVNTFARLEIASLVTGVVGCGTGVLIALSSKDELIQGTGLIIAGVSGLTSLGLQVAALVILKNHSFDNLYVSDKGIGFKIDIK